MPESIHLYLVSMSGYKCCRASGSFSLGSVELEDIVDAVVENVEDVEVALVEVVLEVSDEKFEEDSLTVAVSA